MAEASHSGIRPVGRRIKLRAVSTRPIRPLAFAARAGERGHRDVLIVVGADQVDPTRRGRGVVVSPTVGETRPRAGTQHGKIESPGARGISRFRCRGRA